MLVCLFGKARLGRRAPGNGRGMRGILRVSQRDDDGERRRCCVINVLSTDLTDMSSCVLVGWQCAEPLKRMDGMYMYSAVCI